MTFDFQRASGSSTRRDLVGGLVITALGALQVGLALEAALARPAFGPLFYLACSAALAACGVGQFRAGLRRLPAERAAARDAG